MTISICRLSIVMFLIILNQSCVYAAPLPMTRSISYAAQVPMTKSNSGATGGDLLEALNYMKRYGYLKPNYDRRTAIGPLDPAEIVDSIKDLQVFHRIQETGRLDAATMAAIRKPRCGVTDANAVVHQKQEESTTSRVRRYTVNWQRWDKKLITYSILNYPSNSNITNTQVHDAIRRAFEQYSNVTRLEFKEVSANAYADIYIKFTSWTHGDGYPFDGPNGTVAHAYLPDSNHGDYNGDVHFDDSEYFTNEGDMGYNLYQVALHEIGHSLGLEHSWVYGAVMIPEYPGYYADFPLTEDDIRAVQLLYGSGQPTSADKVQNPKAPCNKAYDAAAMIDGQLYIFKDKRYWRTTVLGKTISPKVGEPIRRRFYKLPRQIDAVYQRPQDGKVVFFKGSKYWVYDKFTSDSTYPRDVTDFGIPEKIDAAVVLNSYNKTYFFKDHMVWRYDEDYKSVDPGYPHDVIDVWEGVPSPVHAAFDFTDGNTYFVQRKKYFRYSSKHRNADPGYPRYFGQDFIGC